MAELKTTLHNDGCIRLGSIGELRYSATGIYDFTPFDEKLTTPQLYGLYGFEMKRLTDTVTPVVEFPLASKPKRTEWNVWRYVAQTAAMIAIALLILCPSTTVKNTETAHGYYAGLIPAELFKQIETQSLVMTPVTSPLKSTEKAALEKHVKKSRRVVKPIAVKEVKVAKPMATPVKDTQAAAPHKAASKRFHIIVASMPTEKDAMEMAQKLKAEGYAQACALIGDGKMRVCLQTFETEAEAYSNISILRQNEAYKNAWVLKK